MAVLRPVVELNGATGIARIDFVLNGEDFIAFTYARATGLVTAAAVVGAGFSLEFDNYRTDIASFDAWLNQQIPAALGAPSVFSGPFSDYAFGPIKKKASPPSLELECMWGANRLIKVEWVPDGIGTVTVKARPAISLDARHFADWIAWHQRFIAAVQDYLAGRR